MASALVLKFIFESRSKGLVLLPADMFFTYICSPTLTGLLVVHSLNLLLPDSMGSYCRQHFLAVRVLRIWNSLHEEVVSADHLSLFIRRLEGV